MEEAFIQVGLYLSNFAIYRTIYIEWESPKFELHN